MPVVNPGQAVDVSQVDQGGGGAVRIVVQHAVDHIDSARHGPSDGHRNDALIAEGDEVIVNLSGGLVIDADHGDPGAGLAVENPLLDRGIMVEIPVAVDMVGGDVQQHRHIPGQGYGQVDLIGRHFDHVAAGLERREIEHRHAEIAADLHILTREGKHMAHQLGGCRFAIGAGYRQIADVAYGARQ